MMMDCIKSWEQVDQLLLDDEDLGKPLSHHSPLRQEITDAKMMEIASLKERTEAVCQLVASRVKWNGKYALWPRSTDETLKEGSGSNADINMLLIQSLKDAGLDASPIVLRSRDKGLLPHNFPSLRKLTTFIVTVENGRLTHLCRCVDGRKDESAARHLVSGACPSAAEREKESLGEPAAYHLSNTPVKIRPELMPSRRAEK